MIHRGEIVEKAVRESGYSITKLADRLGKSRRHIYNLFANPELPVETILEIGKIIHYDFSSLLPRISKYFARLEKETFNESELQYIQSSETVEFWKNKYLLLLEKYNALLEKREETREKK